MKIIYVKYKKTIFNLNYSYKNKIMISSKLLMTQNYKEIEQARELGIKVPDPRQTYSKFLFRKEDVKRAVVDDDKIMLDFYDDESYSIGFDEKLWNELEDFFTENEE